MNKYIRIRIAETKRRGNGGVFTPENNSFKFLD